MSSPASTLQLDTAQALFEPVQQALRNWHFPGDVDSPLTQLLLFRQIARREPDQPLRYSLNRLVQDAMEQLPEEDARLLRQRFQEKMSAFQVANRFNLAESTLYSKQKAALTLLAEQIFAAEHAARSQQTALLTQFLPPSTYTRLFGVDAHISRLAELLSASVPPWIVSIEGLGGIGKTALADAIVRHLAATGEFFGVGWVSAKIASLDLLGNLRPVASPTLSVEEMVTALLTQLRPDLPLPGPERALSLLREHLRAAPHLIVIDNLETLPDATSLLPTLRTLIDPSRFLLTTRYSLRAETHIFPYGVPELDRASALALLRYEAEQTNQSDLLEEAALDSIYQAVGGNPLALRLLIGQSYAYSLESLLADLRKAQGQRSANLYTFIYRRAWEHLDESSRIVFLSMGAVDPAGVSAEFLSQVAPVAPDDLRTSLQHLVMLNLVNVSTGLNKHYSLHSLTRTFLLEQVAQW
jgi:LuxR family glucitol operon transcriptional activator